MTLSVATKRRVLVPVFLHNFLYDDISSVLMCWDHICAIWPECLLHSDAILLSHGSEHSKGLSDGKFYPTLARQQSCISTVNYLFQGLDYRSLMKVASWLVCSCTVIH